MFLIVGLGNPSKEYKLTRHNLGFMFLEHLVSSLGLNAKWSKKFEGEFIKTDHAIYLKPLTYVNASGPCVQEFLSYYRIPQENLMVISDDLDMEFGKVRTRLNGSSGGHNGLRSIEQALSSQDFKRIKIGIGHPRNLDGTHPVKDYVLGKMSKEDQVQLKTIFEKVAQALATLTSGN
jgi:PTH1 family peptidyl-tRNA hydrolase